MHKFKRLACLLAVGMLSACGGGNSDTSTTQPGTGSGGTPTPGISNTITASVVQETMCGTVRNSSNAEILLHDQNWRVLSRLRADATGKISGSISGSNLVNLSVISFSTTGEKEFQVNSYAQHPVGDIGTIVVPGKTSDGCECRNVDVRVTSLYGALNPATTQLTGFSSAEQRKTQAAFNEIVFEQVGLCRVTNGSWPLLTAVSNGGSANAIAASIKQYAVTGNIELSLNQIASIIPVSLNTSNASLVETHYTESGLFGLRTRLYSNEIYVFNQLDGVTFVSIRAAENRVDTVDGTTVFRSASQRQNITPPLTGPLSLNVPFSDAQESLERFLVQDLPSSNNNYNLGAVQGFNTFYLYAQTTLKDGTNYFQSFIGPLQGTYPDEIVPADYGINNKFDDAAPSTVSASVIRYGDSQSYQQFMSDQVERNKLSFEARMTGKWAKYSAVGIQVTTQR